MRSGSRRVDILRRFKRFSQSSSSSSALSPSESKATRSLSVAGERMRLRPFAGGARKPFSSDEVKGLLLARERPLDSLLVPLATIDDVEGRGELLETVARVPFSGVLVFFGTSTLTVRILGFGSDLGVNLGCLENMLSEVSTTWLAGEGSRWRGSHERRATKFAGAGCHGSRATPQAHHAGVAMD